LAIHHTRKMAADDFLDTLSGTQGIAGAADCVIVLKRKRKSAEASLSVTGRDIYEDVIALTVENGRWRLDGDTVQAAAQKMEQRNDAQSNLGDKSLDAVKFVNSRQSTTPKELAAHLGIDNKIAGNLLARLARDEHIGKNHRGTYVSIGSETRESDETAGHSNDDGAADSPASFHSPPSTTADRTTDASARIGQRVGQFIPPAGPGRCPQCGFHVDTQGHKPGCQQTEAGQ
jgi:hypothetical protein